MGKKVTLFSLLAGIAVFAVASTALAAVVIPPTEPTDVSQCKKNGWRNYADLFKNQGDCVSFVVTGGRNQPDGPPVH